MSKPDLIEILARGVCVVDGRLLLCHTKGARNTYLPGGHVEFREKARETLRREVEEELGVKAKVGRFLGVVEHSFMQKGERHCEINLIFELRIPGIDSSKAPDSLEAHISFRWVPIKRLCDSKIEPAVLRKVVASWLETTGEPERFSTISLSGSANID